MLNVFEIINKAVRGKKRKETFPIIDLTQTRIECSFILYLLDDSPTFIM